MRRAPSLEAMVRDPVGRFFVPAPTLLVWCQSTTLAGVAAWGRPSAADLARLFAVFEGAARLASRLSFVLDGRRVEAIDPEAFATLMSWLRRVPRVAHIELQLSVLVAESPLGAALSGIVPMTGGVQAMRVTVDSASMSDDGPAIFHEVDRLVEDARGLPEEVRKVRELLEVHGEHLKLGLAAHRMGVARRTLQRQLRDAGTTFSDEVRRARFKRARDLLVGGGDKIAAVARRLGLSLGALNRLVRENVGCTPVELRRLHLAPGRGCDASVPSQSPAATAG